MPGPAPKRPENRSRLRDGSSLTVLDGSNARIKAPAAPSGVSGSVREVWATFWTSPLAQQTITTDLAALRRLFTMYEQRERYTEMAAENTLSLGSTGQLVLHPLVKQVDVLDAKILALEDRFGLSPMSRLKLQVTLGDASKSLKELNAALAVTDEQPEAEADDPRALVALPPAKVRKSAATHRG